MATKHYFQSRIRLFSFLLIAATALLISRLYYLQILHGNDFADRADRQYVRPVNTTFDRGTIFFSAKDGNLISAATVKEGFLVAINPQKVTISGAEMCAKLQPIIETIDCDDVAVRVSKKEGTYREIAHQIDADKSKEIEKLGIEGLTLYKDRWRIYPGGLLASHVLGFLGFKGNDFGGRYGLESFYEDTLKRDSKSVFVNFFAEIFSNINKTVIQGESLKGDVVTTIEPTTQDFLQKALDEVQQKWSTESTGGVIINPKTGEIYAMALTPTFDPNNFRVEQDVKVFSNDLVENVREMGSIIKPLTMATAIDLGLADANTLYNDTGSITLNNSTIYNFDKQGRGTITMQQAMGESLNMGFVFLSQKIGHDNMRKYFTNFGLGDRTGIDLPNEAKGLISNLSAPRDLEYATASFGQGIAMTPLEVVRALSALANGGTLVTPHVVKQINYKIGIPKEIKHAQGKRVIKEETSKAITDILVEDFDTYFQDGKSKNPRYRIAEKTGTAQIALPSGKGYYDDRNLHSFFGYLPASDPQFLIFLYSVHPVGARYSSESLGPTFVDLTKFLINYYEVVPDR
jgi:cell division protein FtsI (penicillin-binding protein 3)/stage V sporulation protein D (sporulation-specific penicillin-binding protein)